MLNVPQFSKSCPKSSLLPCEITYTTEPLVCSRMGPWQKREDLCPEKKLYDSKPTAVIEPDVSKNAKNVFSCQRHETDILQ